MAYKYNKALFNEKEWNKLISSQNVSLVNEEDLVTLEPSLDTKTDEKEIPIIEEEKKDSELVSFSDILDKEEKEPIFQKPEEDDLIDLDSIGTSMYDEPKPENMENNLEQINENVMNFEEKKSQLENMLKELDEIKNSQNDEIKFDDNLSNIISFNDIEPESFERGGRAA